MLGYSKYLLKGNTQLSLHLRSVSYNFSSIKQFKLPDLGEKIKDATIKKWYVKEGDKVQELDILCDVATDKLFTQIPSAYDGIIHKRYFQEEEACAVGQVLVDIEVDSKPASKKSSSKTTKASAKQTQEPTKQTPEPTQQTAITTNPKREYVKSHILPSVRGLLEENNLNVLDITGTGKDGRVMKQDVLEYLKKFGGKAPQQKIVAVEPQQRPVSARRIAKDAPSSKTSFVMNNLQRELVKNATNARGIPHFNFDDEIDVTDLYEIKAKLGVKGITYLPFLIKSFSLALLDFPIMNSTYEKGNQFEYTIWDNHNISIPIDTPNGLVVPNIKNCQAKSIIQIHNEIQRLRYDAETGNISSNDLADGTISLSNLGSIGGTYFAPLVMSPQVAVVSIGKIMVLPKHVANEKGEEELKPRKIVNVSFAADHRVLDGATVAKFSKRWQSYLENPSSMLLSLR